jgi:hypothetical protein
MQERQVHREPVQEQWRIEHNGDAI